MKIKLSGLIFQIISLITLNAFAQDSLVTISGTLKKFNNAVKVDDNSELSGLLLPSTNLYFIPDNAGRFSITFKLKKPTYYRIGFNTIYLSPGDKLLADIDLEYAQRSLFKGSHCQENNYLKDIPYSHSGSFLEAGDSIKSTIQKTIDYILNAAAHREKALKSNENVSKEFKYNETARIRADVIRSLLLIEAYYPVKHKFSKDSLVKFSEDYDKLIVPCINKYATNFVDPSFLKLEVYRDIAYYLLWKYKSNDTIADHEVSDWVNAKAIVKQMLRLNDKNKLKTYQPKIDSISTVIFHNAVEETYHKLTSFSKGDNAIDFTATDINDKPVSLKNFAGKIIYVDLWATWCEPCLEELKYLEQLKEKYKNDDNIVFVSVSIDANKKNWVENLSKRKANGVQLRIDIKDLTAYNIDGIPRTIIIDKQFKIADMYGLKPSDKTIIDYLNNLLK